MFGWGCNDKGQLGLGDPTGKDVHPKPKRIGSFGPEDGAAVQVVATKSSSFVVVSSGDIFVFGSNADAALGLDARKTFVGRPTRLETVRSCVDPHGDPGEVFVRRLEVREGLVVAQVGGREGPAGRRAGGRCR